VTSHPHETEKNGNGNGNGAVKIPRWTLQIVWPVCVLAGSLLTRYMDVSSNQTKQDDQIQILTNRANAIDGRLNTIEAEQRAQSIFRQHMVDFEEHYKQDLDSILTGQREMIHQHQMIIQQHKARAQQPELQQQKENQEDLPQLNQESVAKGKLDASGNNQK